MQILVWVEYEIVGDDEYSYVEKYETRVKSNLYSVWRTRFVHDLLARGIVVKSIKELEVSYVRD